MRCVTRYLLHEELGEESRHQDLVKAHQRAKAVAWLEGFNAYPHGRAHHRDPQLAWCWGRGWKEARERVKE
jgi:hypothetical protein